MSTRSVVKVINNGKSIELYHHCDGYPEGVGYCLLKIMEEYKTDEYSDINSLVMKMITKGNFEVTFYNHCDIEYFYELNFDKKQVNCMAVNNWNKTMEILEHIDLVYDKEKDAMVDEEIFEGV